MRDPATLRLLLAAGEDPADAYSDTLLEMGGRYRQPLGQAAESYTRDGMARRGTANPEPIRSAFWQEMIETGWNAYRARRDYPDRVSDPVWCHERFGRSLTPLPDGRIIGIAGEHEDYYDPDFYIYNDVIVYGPDGASIFGYTPEAFPPTDFHSATLVDGTIHIIGNFGYPADRRPGHTPVFALSVADLSIRPVETRGPAPGWIGKHRALYVPEHGAIYVWGGWVLCGTAPHGARLRLDTMCWEPVPWLPGGEQK